MGKEQLDSTVAIVLVCILEMHENQGQVKILVFSPSAKTI